MVNRLAAPVRRDARSLIKYGLQLLKSHGRFIGSSDVMGIRCLGYEGHASTSDWHNLDNPTHQLIQDPLNREVREHGASEIAKYARKLPIRFRGHLRQDPGKRGESFRPDELAMTHDEHMKVDKGTTFATTLTFEGGFPVYTQTVARGRARHATARLTMTLYSHRASEGDRATAEVMRQYFWKHFPPTVARVGHEAIREPNSEHPAAGQGHKWVQYPQSLYEAEI